MAVGPQATVLRSDESDTDCAGGARSAPDTPLELVIAGQDWSEVKATVGGASTKASSQTSAATGIVLGVTGPEAGAGLVGSFFLGAIMPLGIGYYAPCMVLIALLGMNPSAAFPIMMGACAFLMPVASTQFVRQEALQPAGGRRGWPSAASSARRWRCSS